MMQDPKISPSIDDLADFYKQWPTLRTEANSLQQDPRLTETQRCILEWMILLIDRVGPADLTPDT